MRSERQLLLLISICILMTCVSSVHLPHLYTNQRFQNEFQRQPQPSETQYPNHYQQGQGYNNNYNNNNFINNNNNKRQPPYQGSGQPRYPQRELNQRGVPNRQPPSANSSLERISKCRIWVPVEVVEKYPHATLLQINKGLQMIETCCEGYEAVRLRGSTHCRPACENCQNGICIAPNECQCHEEYVKNDNGDCVFTCPIACLNGKCYMDGTCECDPGYKLDETRKFCRPICSGGCGQNVRHNCTEPEVCGCGKGYRLTDTGCEPTCDPDCGLGGTCVEANVCECERGTTLKHGVCQSDCYQSCANGVCFSRNRCICNPGFTYHENSTQCVLV